MEQQPHNPDNEDHRIPELERLELGEIDLTGVVRQDESLADVIGDAIGEAEGGNGEIPDWGARTLARALANERGEPMTGALHHFAVTGRADPEAMARELAELYAGTENEETREWVNWLGTYVIRMPDRTDAPTEASQHDDEVLDLGRSPEEFSERLRLVFAEADARGEAIAVKDARAIATVLSLFLDPDSQMARFADTGDANPVLLSQECQSVKGFTELSPHIDAWIGRLEQHLASRSDLGRQPTSPERTSGQPEAPVPTDEPAVKDEGIPVFGTPLEQVTAYLRIAFAEADARGEPVTHDDAQRVAMLLAAILPLDSEMNRFALTGEGDPLALQRECTHLQASSPQPVPINSWIEHFEQYLAASASVDKNEPIQAEPSETALDTGGRGDALRAYLQLPDVDPDSDDVLQGYQDAYLGFVGSMAELLDQVRDVMAAPAAEQGIDLNDMDDAALERAARMTWDIVEVDGRFYLFSK
jgi:hypothetical protein